MTGADGVWHYPPGIDAWAWYFLQIETFDRTLPGRWSQRGTEWLPDPYAQVWFRGRWCRAASACAKNAQTERSEIPEAFRSQLVLRDAALKLVYEVFGRTVTREDAERELAARGVSFGRGAL